ncbi:MAG TPA: hypothetical protein VGM54_13730 [Chthoniobacter sp.]|jgi:hypothetical protein
MDEIPSGKWAALFAAFLERSKISVRSAAGAIGCSQTTMGRLIVSKTKPSAEMLKQSAVMIELGYERYRKLTKAEKEKISEAIGAVGGGTLGFAAVTAAISTLGISGLSAAGITSGLAALGAIVGGGMVAGVTVAAAIPIAAGALGYGIILAVKGALGKYRLDKEKYDPLWELPWNEKEGPSQTESQSS